MMCVQARLHVAEGAPDIALQSLAHLMARVQRAVAHSDKQESTQLQALRNSESDVRGTVQDVLPQSAC